LSAAFGGRRCSVIVLLESNGIHFWSSSPFLTRMLVEKRARIVRVADRAEELANPAIVTDELAPEEPRTN
jgi:hypothetical protein